MGTNYYWYKNLEPCECCGKYCDPIHIGKSSGGWNFSLHIHPESGINSLVDWVAKFTQSGSAIINEYGSGIIPDEMIDIITNRSWEPSSKRNAQWYADNYAHEGINGLVAHNVDGRHCIRNGEGTYDYMVGDFS